MTLTGFCLRIMPWALVLSWSCSTPAGEYKIALVPARGGQRGLYAVNSDSTGAKFLSTQGSVQLRSNSWCPNGKMIAYFSVGPGDAEIMNNYRIPSHSLLYRMTSAGADQQRLLEFPVSSFAWSPDCGRMLYVSSYEDPQREDFEIVRGARQPLSAVYIFDLKSGRQTRATELGYHCSAAWSPDGIRIALSFGDDPKRSNIYVASLDGKHTRRFEDSGTLDVHPAWAPNGKTLAYVSVSVPGENSPGAGVYSIDADGTHKKQITNLQISEVSWSPDGRMLLLSSVNALYVVAAEGGNPAKVSGILERPMDAVFTPDGAKVMFRSNHEGDWHLYTVSLDGANLKRVVGQLSAAQFCLSPLLR